MHAVGMQLERGLDVVVDDERHAELAEARARAARSPPSPALTRSCTTVAPAVTAQRAPSRCADDRVHLHRVRALRVERRGIERRQRVVQADVERAGALGVTRSLLAGDAERDERLCRRFERPVGVDGEEAAGERARDAPRAGDRGEHRVAVLDRDRPPAVRDVVDRPGDRRDQSEALRGRAAASSAASPPASIDSTPRTSASTPTSVATSPALPRRTVTRTSSRIRPAVSVR